MINRHYKEGEKLNVADLNEITVLIDRSETELTEVALNIWPAELNGPPHQHGQKEQIFLITAGSGTIKVGEQSFDVKTGDLVYVPAGTTHQTVNPGPAPLEYLLFNAFSDSGKEGHATFAEHIEKVKQTRKKQAESQNAEVDTAVSNNKSEKKGKFISSSDYKSMKTEKKLPAILLNRTETGRCEVELQSLNKDGSQSKACQDKEQTLFVLSGTADINIEGTTESFEKNYVVFIPRSAEYTLKATGEELALLSFGTIIEK